MRFVPKDRIFRPKECFWLLPGQLMKLLNAGLVEERVIDGRSVYRKVTCGCVTLSEQN